MYKLQFLVPSSDLFTLYNSLVLPYLSYCIVWGNSSQTRMDVLFKLQKRAICICTNSNYRAQMHSAPLCRKLKTLNVNDVFLYHTAIVGFQYFQCVLPSSISSMFLTNSQIHDHYTRKSNLLHLWKVKTTYSKTSTRYNVPQDWSGTHFQTISDHIQICLCLKRNLKLICIQSMTNCNYSIFQ